MGTSLILERCMAYGIKHLAKVFNFLPYSADNFYFNKGLCMILNKGTLSKHKLR